VMKVLTSELCMANIMTASLAQAKFKEALMREIGHSRSGCPYHSFIMLNSGSEANEIACRIMDVHTGHHSNGRPVCGLSMVGSFHGRTFRPAMMTDTSVDTYKQHSCYWLNNAIEGYALKIKPNDMQGLADAFAHADAEGYFIETLFLEGVMGEGNPGYPITPQFYATARRLTEQHGSLLLVDSVQAGLRVRGVLSIVDYPGFANLAPPDFETFSKAINGGQFPSSVVALSERAASFYRHGIYGNTMTGNPRACLVGTAVLQSITPEIRQNIVEMGDYAVRKYEDLKEDLPGAITQVMGTGLLYSVQLNPEVLTVVALDGAEMWLRRHGVNVIHGGANALRFTPNFDITQGEIDMQVMHVRQFITTTLHEFNMAKGLDKQTWPKNESSVACFHLMGHLFDTSFVNDMLDIVESKSCSVSLHNVEVGCDWKHPSSVTVQMFSPNDEITKKLLNEINIHAGKGQVDMKIVDYTSALHKASKGQPGSLRPNMVFGRSRL